MLLSWASRARGLASPLRAVAGPPGTVRWVLLSAGVRYGTKALVILALVALLGISLTVATGAYVTFKISYAVLVAARNQKAREGDGGDLDSDQ